MVKQTGLVGIDDNFVKDGFIGIAIGVAILFLGFLVPGIGTIGVPSVPASLSSATSKFVVVVLLASIFETFFFFDIVISFFKDKSKRFGIKKIPFWLVALISSFIFAGFHLSAYGNFADASGAFVTATIMGLVFAYERKFTNSNIPGILTHMVLNWWIAFGSLAIITSLITLIITSLITSIIT